MYSAGRPAGGLVVRVLGPVEIGSADGAMTSVAQPILRVLIGLLAVAAGRVVSVEALVDGLWGEQWSPARDKNLHSRISALRRLLEETEPTRSGSRVVRSSGGYLLELDAGGLDAREFGTLTARGREAAQAGAATQAAGLFRQALSLWRGPALADATPLCLRLADEAERLEQARANVVEERVECDLALGRHGELVTELTTLAAEYPLRERLAGQLMVALWRSGRRGEALAAYDRTRRVLGAELGLDPGPQLRELHARVLADDPFLAGPGAIWAVPTVPAAGAAVPAAGAAAPAFPAAAPSRGNMPAPVASFVGREAELAELGKLLERHRLVTITGPGGAGKTRLAIEVTAPLASVYPDGAWFADLAEVTDPAVVPDAIAGALSIRLAPGESAERQLIDGVAGMRAMVVVDNCEHVIDTAAALVERMLESGPGIRVLATSRQALGVPGETVWETPPIAFPRDAAGLSADALASFDAVRLFTERLTREASPAELRVIAGITATLEGLPLAIELAAARAARLGFGPLAATLSDRVGLSLLRSRTGRRRQQTLDATIAWSYDLLTLELRCALRALSVFAGGFTLEAAAAVTGAGDITGTVDALAERSLIMVDRDAADSPGVAPPRYRMLETIRQFCAVRITTEDGPDADAALHERHSRYFADLARRAAGPLTGPDQGHWLTALEFDHANLLAALSHLFGQPGRVGDALAMVVDLDRFWHNRGHLGECADLLTRGLEVTDEVISPALRCRALNLAGQADLFYDLGTSRAYFTDALALARESGEGKSTATALWGLASVLDRTGEADAAATYAVEAVGIARSAGDLVLLGECLTSYAGCLQVMGQVSEAAAVYQETLDVTHRSGDRIYAGLSRNNAGDLALIRGDIEVARRHFERALTILDEIRATGPIVVSNLGWVLLIQGDLDAARAAFAEAVRRAELQHYRREGSWGIVGLACTATAQRDWERAARLFGFADAEMADCGGVWVPPEKTFRERWLGEAEQQSGGRLRAVYDSVRGVDRHDLLDYALGRRGLLLSDGPFAMSL